MDQPKRRWLVRMAPETTNIPKGQEGSEQTMPLVVRRTPNLDDWPSILETLNTSLEIFERLLAWWANTWPDDPTLLDGNWREQMCQIIEKYADFSVFQVPDLYRARFEPAPVGVVYDAGPLVAHLFETHPEATSQDAYDAWLRARAIPSDLDQQLALIPVLAAPDVSPDTQAQVADEAKQKLRKRSRKMAGEAGT